MISTTLPICSLLNKKNKLKLGEVFENFCDLNIREGDIKFVYIITTFLGHKHF